ncbi:MAG: PDZ domain-containing protein [Magnetococcales bacterium]|nr:PDZ domain-containing protein [Magnetococcales bacterium]
MRKSTLLAWSSALLLGATSASYAAGGWIGIHLEPPKGVQVGDVIKESPADKSGLQRGDVILRLNDREVVSLSQFSMEIQRLDPGSEVTLSVHRKNEIKNVKVKLDNGAEHAYALPNMNPGTPYDPSPFAFNRSPLPLKPFGSVGPAHSHDYQTRLKSAWSMLEAYERIAEEKKLGEKGSQFSGEIRGLLNQAQQMFDKYQINEGMSQVEVAYNKMQDALIRMRKGETLVQSKKFPSPEVEYVYELGSNNVFQMLLEQALNVQSLSPESAARIEEARALRGKAEESAAKQEFKTGIGQLEQSTAILTELLRKAGLDIP